MTTHGWRGAWLAAAACGLPAIAAAAEGGGMPQLNPATYSPQIVWLVIAFLLLYWAMSKVAVPKISAAIETRADKIRGDLDRAAALKTEAEKAMADYERALAEARGRAQEMTSATDATLAKQAAERRAALGGELAGRIKQAEGRIAAAKATAMGNIASVAAETARLAVERVAGLAVAPADAEAAAREALASRAKA